MSAGDAREAEEPRDRKGVEDGDHRVDGDVAGFECSEAGRSGERRAAGGGAEQADRLGGRERVGARRKRGQGRGVFRLEGGGGEDDVEQRALLERARVDEQVERERVELGAARHVRAAIASERCSGDCGLYCSAVTNEMRMGVDREDSGAARRVRWLRKRNDGVTFLKMANGRIETSRSSRAPSKGVRQHGDETVRRGWQARRCRP